MVLIETKERVSYTVIEGKEPKFSLRTKAKDFPSWLNAQLSQAGRKNNMELEFFLREIKRAYEFYHPIRQSKPDEVWDTINENIDRSKIKRYDWNLVFGRSLTQEILSLKLVGHNVDETFEIIKKDQRFIEFLQINKKEADRILDNLKISVHARFGENNTALKVMEEVENDSQQM
jgi:hypothetical protein